MRSCASTPADMPSRSIAEAVRAIAAGADRHTHG
jgi:hypothetical protein